MSLEGKTDIELKALLKSLGGETRGGRIKRETILERIYSMQATPLAQAEKTAVMPIMSVLGVPDPSPIKQPDRIDGCSEEEIIAACKPHIDRGMEIKFEDDCWIFNRKGRMDSGTMSQPLRNIKNCADSVCQEAIPAARIGLTKSLLF